MQKSKIKMSRFVRLRLIWRSHDVIWRSQTKPEQIKICWLHSGEALWSHNANAVLIVGLHLGSTALAPARDYGANIIQVFYHSKERDNYFCILPPI